MRLFLKHILRSIKKAPLQPLIILLTLTIAVATFVATAEMSFATVEEIEYKKGRVDKSSDITVMLSGSDEVRILFKEDAERIIGEDGTVMGEFSLTAITGEKEKHPVTVIATELREADSFYSLSLTENALIPERELDDSVILSTELSSKLGLSKGDTFKIDLLGLSFDFKVAAIAKSEGVLYDAGAIINIGAVTEALSDANPFIGAFADSVTPFTRLKIKLNDAADIDRYIDLLSEDEAFSEKSILKNSENRGSEDFAGMLAMIAVLVCALIILLLCALVITTSLDLLSKERMADMGLFMLSGADTRTLNLILYLECLIYSAAAAALGLLLSLPLMRGMNGIFDFRTGDVLPSPIDIPIAIIAAPISVITVAFINAKKEGALTISERLQKTNEKTKTVGFCKLFLTFLAFSVVFLITSLLVPVRLRFPFGIASALSLIGFIFTFVPFFATSLSRLTSSLLERKNTPRAPLLISQKNMTVSYPIKHTTRLITLLLTLLSTAFFCINTLTTQLRQLGNMVDSEYIAIGADEKSDAIAESTEGVSDSFRIFVSKSLTTEHGSGLMAISVSDGAIGSINESIRPERLPLHNEVVLSSGLAILTQKRVGDSITLKYLGNSYDYEIIDIIPTGANIVFLDAERIGEKNDLLCIDAAFTEDSEAFASLSEAMNLRGAYFATTDDVIMPLLNDILSFADMARYVLYIALFTTLVGIINVLFSDYVTRKREKDVYYTVGMTAAEIRRVGFFEVISTLLIALILVPIFSSALSFLLDFSLSSFGVDLIPI